jgi:hypothetical protein
MQIKVPCCQTCYINLLANLLDSLFIHRSWDIYLSAREEQAHQLTLKEFVDNTLREYYCPCQNEPGSDHH